MILLPPRSTRTDTLFPYTTLIRCCLVDDLRAARGRERDTLLRLTRDAAFEQLGKLGFGFELFTRSRGGGGRYGRGGNERRDEVTHGSTPVFIIAYPAPFYAARREQRLTRRCFSTLRSEEHTSELQSLMRISYAVFCLKKKKP